jgi:hypothetical protein
MAAGDGNRDMAVLWFEMAARTPFPTDAVLFVSKAMYDEYPRRRLEDLGRKIELSQPKSAPVPELRAEKRDDAVPAGIPRIYSLPSDRGRAFLAAAALSACAKENGKFRFEVSPADEWQERLSEWMGLGICRNGGEVMPLEVPTDLRSRHVVEWYCLSAGFVVKDWRVGKGRMASRGSSPVVFPVAGWQEEKLLAVAGELSAAIGSQDVQFDVIVGLVSSASLVVCDERWVQHLAAMIGVPAVVLWSGGSPEVEGWPENENLVSMRGDISSVGVDAVVAIVKRRISHAMGAV